MHVCLPGVHMTTIPRARRQLNNASVQVASCSCSLTSLNGGVVQTQVQLVGNDSQVLTTEVQYKLTNTVPKVCTLVLICTSCAHVLHYSLSDSWIYPIVLVTTANFEVQAKTMHQLIQQASQYYGCVNAILA